MRTVAAVLAASVLGVAPLSASAQQPVYYYDPPPRRPIAAVTGLEIDIRGGFGGHLDESSTAFTQAPPAQDHLFWPGFALQSSFGARFVPWMSIGAHAGYQNNPERDLPPGTTRGWTNSYSLGFYTRFYGGAALHLGYFDPWVGVGVDPYAAVFVGHATPLGDIHTHIDAIAIPVSLGLDVLSTRHIAFGVMGQVSPWIPQNYCSGPPGASRLTCVTRDLAPDPYFFVGIGGRMTLGR